jgi:hypothetical protein
MYMNAEIAPILSALRLVEEIEAEYNNGLFGFERSFPENPDLIKTFFSGGISSTVTINAARENPTEA